MPDLTRSIIERIDAARQSGEKLLIRAGGSKTHLGLPGGGTPLELAEHAGILDYEPRELVLTARAGTPITVLEAALEQHNQILGFEPPRLAGRATLGGTLATHLSGPARPWRGSVRDAVLGIRLINGKAELLRFGGQVMKNVAGFDASRLQAGAFGTLGVMTEISVRVLPRPETELTLVRETTAAAALTLFASIRRTPIPLSAAAWYQGQLYLRLAGGAANVTAAAQKLGGSQAETAVEFWDALRERRLPLFSAPGPVWRFSLKPTAPLDVPGEDLLIDWAGAQRFVATPLRLTELASAARSGGGHVSLAAGDVSTHGYLSEPPTAIRTLHLRIKRAFDPGCILNQGRLYGWL